ISLGLLYGFLRTATEIVIGQLREWLDYSGCPDGRIHLCNSTFLAKVLEGKLRLLPDITLAAIKVFVDEMFHIKIGNNCARKTSIRPSRKLTRSC
ncbi:hypothetical protein Leryth_018215, partial [Lithospermum erythrorhizon]